MTFLVFNFVGVGVGIQKSPGVGIECFFYQLRSPALRENKFRIKKYGTEKKSNKFYFKFFVV